MADISQFDEASQTLQNVDVSDIVSSLAMGIAEAQEKLDNNSVQQLIRLSQQKIGDKSLVELGFVPAFYAFEYADVSASLNLKMRLNTSINIGLQLELDNYRELGYKKENIDIVETERSEEHRREYKSSSDVVIKSSSSKKIKVNNESMSLDKSKGSVTMIDSFKEKLQESSEIDRATHTVISDHNVTEKSETSGFIVQDSLGFVTISMPGVSEYSWGILELTDYSVRNTINLNSETPFFTGTDFEGTSYNAANKISSSSQDITQFDFKRLDKLNVYFGWNLDSVDYNYEEKEKSGDTVYGNTETTVFGTKTVNLLEEKLKFLARILNNAPSVRVNISGHTDSSGESDYNNHLSTRRIIAVSKELTGMGVNANQIISIAKGEEVANAEESNAPSDGNRNVKYRQVEVELVSPADYIVFIGPDFNKKDTDDTDTAYPGPLINKTDKFIVIKDVGDDDKATKLNFKYGDTVVDVEKSTGFSELSDLESEEDITENFNMETRGNIAYLLHNESKLKFTTLSKESEKINIKEDIDESDSEESYRSEVEVYDSIDRNYFLQKDSEIIKNPGTIAFSAELDARYSRQFEMSVEANASVSARLKAIPGPEKFLEYINEDND